MLEAKRSYPLTRKVIGCAIGAKRGEKGFITSSYVAIDHDVIGSYLNRTPACLTNNYREEMNGEGLCEGTTGS